MGKWLNPVKKNVQPWQCAKVAYEYWVSHDYDPSMTVHGDGVGWQGGGKGATKACKDAYRMFLCTQYYTPLMSLNPKNYSVFPCWSLCNFTSSACFKGTGRDKSQSDLRSALIFGDGGHRPSLFGCPGTIEDQGERGGACVT